MAALLNSDNHFDVYQPNLTDAHLYSTHNEEGETDVDAHEKESTVKSVDASASVSMCSERSTGTSSLVRQRSTSRSYKFVQLEQALAKANLLQTNNEQIELKNAYLDSLRTDTFDAFLGQYDEKIRQHSKQMKHEKDLKRSRPFTSLDLKKNFLALDPSRDVRIVFTDPSQLSLMMKLANPDSPNAQSSSSADAAVEAFYAQRSSHLLRDPYRAREEINTFVRRAGERLNERLPRMSSAPHRVKIIDERDTIGKPDERTLLQMRHARALSSVNKRRQILAKMMTQSKKNQSRMQTHDKRVPLSIDTASYCRELLEQANQIDDNEHSERVSRARVERHSSQATSDSTSSASSSPRISATSDSFASSSIPFQHALSMNEIERRHNVRVLRPSRPLTAPMKAAWSNYC